MAMTSDQERIGLAAVQEALIPRFLRDPQGNGDISRISTEPPPPGSAYAPKPAAPDLGDAATGTMDTLNADVVAWLKSGDAICERIASYQSIAAHVGTICGELHTRMMAGVARLEAATEAPETPPSEAQ